MKESTDVLNTSEASAGAREDNFKAQQALRDIRSIRKTIDDVTGASFFNDALFSMGTLFVFAGVMVIILSGVTKAIIMTHGINSGTIKVIAGIWAGFVILSGLWKFRILSRQSEEKGLSFYGYMRKLMSGYFINLDLPLELSYGVVIVYFILNHQYHQVIPLTVLWLGTLIAILGPVFSEKCFTAFGYLYILAGAAGLLFFGEYVLYYTASVFGLFFVIVGVLMHIRYRNQSCEETSGQLGSDDTTDKEEL